MDNLTPPPQSAEAPTTLREVRCKDCLKERARGTSLDPEAPKSEADEHFEYNEAWAQRLLERGGSRTDRCTRHRRLHNKAIQGLAVAYIDLKTIGEVVDRDSPMGALGGLGPLPDVHTPIPKEPRIPFSKFGMKDHHVREIFQKMTDPNKRVLVLKAGTGTGKSTFGPFRLLVPPEGVDFSFTDRGPIVVTEPRVQATIGVARYVGERLVMGCPLMECSVHGSFNPRAHVDDPNAPAGPSCPDEECTRPHVGDHPGPKQEDPACVGQAGHAVDCACCTVSDCARHIGPGYRVGYQVAGDKNHDDACELVYVTDGTMINWLREGRLANIGTVIVDEAHERSTNIDFIMGYLRREIDRYPHLRVIITSATFDVDFYEDYFGGPERVHKMDVPAEKTFGFGAPLFPITNGVLECGCERDRRGALPHPETSDFDEWLREHWPEANRIGPVPDDGSPAEDLWETTAKLHDLRFPKPLPMPEWQVDISNQAKTRLGRDLAEHVVTLANALDERQIWGDILAFLPNQKLIDDAVCQIESRVDPDNADVFALIQSASTEQKQAALESRPRGSKRKIVVSTNLAETSLTVSGVRFVVDCALTTQGAWDPVLASKSVPTTLHSQAGVRQRWGRVGRDAPGWVFPLYTRSQFDLLPRDTPPGSTRDNLEQLVMKAKAGGIDDVTSFKWPAAHRFGDLDESALNAIDIFEAELRRADKALVTNGSVDADGHLTPFGKELERFGKHSTAFAVATMIADQLACVPEVVTALCLLEDAKPQGNESVDLRNLALFNRDWPGEWRLMADRAWQQIQVGCRDDVDLVLRIVGLWERADRGRRPWEPSAEREAWAHRWWLDHDILLKFAELRRSVLESLSTAMKEEVKRLLDPRLAPRARAVISRAYVGMRYVQLDDGYYQAANQPEADPVSLAAASRLARYPDDIIALTRARDLRSGNPEIRNVVATTPWAANDSLSALDLLLQCMDHAAARDLARTDIDHALSTIEMFPVGAHLDVQVGADNAVSSVHRHDAFAFPGETIAEADEELLQEPLAAQTETAADDDATGSTAWPGGNRTPHEDEDALEARRLEEPDDDSRDTSTGHSLGIELNDDEPVGHGRVVDILQDDKNDERLHPRYRLMAGTQPLRETGIYRCAGYELQGEEVAVLLDRVKAAAEGVSDPAQHPDLTYGSYVDTIVRELLQVRGQALRVLHRADGKGRFLLAAGRPGTGNPLVALDPFNQHIVEDLQIGERLPVMVVPTRYGTAAATLVPLLSRHLDHNSVRRWGAPTADAMGKRRPFWDATVHATPNGSNYATLEVLPHDPVLRITHRFGMRIDPGSPLAKLVEHETTPVRLSLRGNFRMRLVPTLDDAKLEEIAQRHRGALHVNRDDRGRVYLSAGRPLTDAARDDLLNADRSRNWQLRVWDFYLSSHTRTVEGLEPNETTTRSPVPLPRPEAPVEAYEAFAKDAIVLGVVDESTDAGVRVRFATGATGFSTADHLPRGRVFVPGDDVRCRVHHVSPGERRLTLDLNVGFAVHAELPPHWLPIMRSGERRRKIAEILGSTVQSSGATLTAHAATEAEADALVRALPALLNSPAAAVDVPADRVGTVIGKQGANIDAAKAIQGVLRCDIADGQLIVSAVSDAALKACLDVAISPARLIRGRMTVPPGKNGALIGPGGSIVKELKRESGCRDANAGQGGSPEWTLGAGSQQALERFVELANQRVHGCTLRVEGAEEADVYDLAAGRLVSDWRAHAFGRFAARAWRTEQPIFNLRPTSAAVASRSTDPGPDSPSDVSVLSEDDFHLLLSSLRRTLSVRADTTPLSPSLRSRVASYLYGLAGAHHRATVDVTPDSLSFVVRWPDVPARPPVAFDGHLTTYEVSTWDHQLESMARALRLGSSIAADVSSAEEQVRDSLYYYLAGIAMALELKLSVEPNAVIIVQRP
ncbi:HrpA-like RNA helicase [Geodermatophilus bullaregiensis]|uniref:KH domain-containing protein n=1 Tax=Geodermatophilus bullaregiensis TaxID=1564160 RepID=UPI001959EE50|nr:KH domain-containing protein [Geodermatophilus bullaregiensis]MBM7804189.1 HrpA-like RNA helicase [Geodermatophilus bullaregiensis]